MNGNKPGLAFLNLLQPTFQTSIPPGDYTMNRFSPPPIVPPTGTPGKIMTLKSANSPYTTQLTLGVSTNRYGLTLMQRTPRNCHLPLPIAHHSVHQPQHPCIPIQTTNPHSPEGCHPIGVFSAVTHNINPETAMPPPRSMAAPLSSSAPVPTVNTRMNMVSHIVSCTMGVLAAAPLSAPINTGAPSVRAPTTVLSYAPPAEFCPIVTPLITDAWDLEL
ncbi:hypothetical protein P691DRAFT_766179 [Macrolepiota fuliginosa MF-IS2]|uniref:Uncharacterized protein n=1 Tax=Macrolepiota fuliginosa MF-IS2 TaxID=1400762 RepID=A0A9P5WZP5_9AGAR|nr:hypothetical protein P691DRAFT_766179 [Macrolepiota fuliginosa MF-IS2]